MRYSVVISVILLVLQGSLSQAQQRPQHDLSLYNKATVGAFTLSPKYVYGGSRFWGEARYNFEAADALAAYVGLCLRDRYVLVAPKLGYITGRSYRGVALELQFQFAAHRDLYDSTATAVTAFLLVNYCFGLPGYPNVFYQWGEYYVPLVGPLQVGFSEWVYWQIRTGGRFDHADVGPSVRVGDGGWYMKLGYAFRLSTGSVDRLFVTLGYQFSPSSVWGLN